MTTIGVDLTTAEAVGIEDASRPQGLYIIGKTGMGKSTLLERLIVADLQAGRGIALFDPHGDLSDSILSKVPSNRIDDVVLLDVGDDEYPFGLNLFESNEDSPNARSRATDIVVQAFKKVWGVGADASWGPMLEDLLRNCTYTLLANPGMSLAELPRLLYEPTYRGQLLRNVDNIAVLDFWEYDYPANATSREARDARRSTINKVRAFLADPTILHIVGQATTTFNLREIMDEEQILIVKLGLDAVGEEGVALLGSVLIGQILATAITRRDTAYRPVFHLYADEYQRFATPAFATLIDEARKYGVATTIAHQRGDQLVFEHRQAPLGAATVVVFQVTPPDAEVLSGLFELAPSKGKVTGQREIRSNTNDPVGFMLHHGGTASPLNNLTTRYLSRLETAISSLPAHEEAVHVGTGGQPWAVYISTRGDLSRGRELINRFLVDCMAKRFNHDPEMMKERVLEVAVQLRAFIGWHQGRNQYTHDPEPVRPSLYQAIDDYLLDWDELKHKFVIPRTVDYQDVMQSVYRQTGSTNSVVTEVKREAQSLIDFLHTLEWAGHWIEHEPLLQGSGIYEDLHEERPFHDLRAELTMQLATLPRYQAMVRSEYYQGLVAIVPDETPSELSLRGKAYERAHACHTNQLEQVQRQLLGRRQATREEQPIASALPDLYDLPVRKRGERGV